MRSVTAIVLLAFVTQAQDSMDHLVDKLVGNNADELFLRMSKASHLQHMDLDETAFGKPSNAVTRTSRVSPSSTLPSANFRTSSLRNRLPLEVRSRLASNVAAHGVSKQQMDAKAEALPTRRMALAGAVGLPSALFLDSNHAKAGPLNPLDLLPKGGPSAVEIAGDKLEAVIRKKIESGTLGISRQQITRLLLHDALTYDPQTDSGGLSGSIRLPEELKRPENKGLEPVVKKLESIQKDLQKEIGVQISFADTEAFVAQMIAGEEFKADFCSKVAPPCEFPYKQFGNPPKRLPLGRKDADKPAPEGRVPGEDASVEDLKAAFKKLGLTKKQLAILADCVFEDPAKGPEFLTQDDKLDFFLRDMATSKKTISATSYQINFYEAIEDLVVDKAAEFDRSTNNAIRRIAGEPEKK